MGTQKTGERVVRSKKQLTFQIVGLVLMVVGLLVGVWIFYVAFIQDKAIIDDQANKADKLVEIWSADAPDIDGLYSTINPPVLTEPDIGTEFATIRIPRFGEDYVYVIAEGTSTGRILDKGYIGHYVDTAMPGGLGNFAIAGHRTANGAGFHDLLELQVGDRVFIETSLGTYIYKITSSAIVSPSEVSVIDANPTNPGERPRERFLTMTTCNPLWSDKERIAVHAKLESWVGPEDKTNLYEMYSPFKGEVKPIPSPTSTPTSTQGSTN